MAKDRRQRGKEAQWPANDNSGAEELTASDPERVRAMLKPLVKLLAREAAQDWLARIANDNLEKKAEPTPPDKDRNA